MKKTQPQEITQFGGLQDQTKRAARESRQKWTNYRCSDQGLAGFVCQISTIPDSGAKETQAGTCGKKNF